MNAQALIRPGLSTGIRPERQSACELDQIDQIWARWFSQSVGKHLQSFANFSKILRQIETAEDQIVKLTAQGRHELLVDLRNTLRKKTRSHADLAKTFALIRHGMQQTLGIRLYDEQLYAGWCLHEGHFVEMQTGEGKTVTAALPAISMALAGVPVHVVTSNEYLAQRDLDSLAPVYEWFGLSSSVVLSIQDDAQRHDGYACNITYCTHQQLVFDYLRDTRGLENQRNGLHSRIQELLQEDTAACLQRGLCFAVVDEADSVLIDDARTPLILAESVGADDDAVAEAAVALAIARTLNEGKHFELDRQTKQVNLLNPGQASIEIQTANLKGNWKLPRYRDERIVQALSAVHCYHCDNEYLVADNAVVLIDKSTGRPMPQRRLQHGLHRILEVKERCRVSDETAAVSALSFQGFFTRYLKLSGMSGTLRESRFELRRVYGPRTVSIPTVKPCRRQCLPRMVLANRDEQLAMMLKQLTKYRNAGRAVLIGTRTLGLSETISEVLNQAGVPHEVLNARQDGNEARMIAQAGETACVTVATNMAGRGTDICCSERVLAQGGLHVMNLELNDAARIDRQLHGRAARQGEPGSFQDIFCLDDEVLKTELNEISFRLLSWAIQYPRSSGFQALTELLVRRAQQNVESRYRRVRVAVRDGQTRLQKTLAISGYGE